MKAKTFKTNHLAIIFLGSLTLATPGFCLEYSNPESHFSFSIPRNWQQIPSEVIHQVMKAALSQTSAENPNFEAGFQKTADYYISYPYLFIKSYPADRGSISKIAKSFSASDFEKAAERLETTALIRNFKSGNPVVDSNRKMVMIGTNLEVANVGPVRSLTVISPGRESVVEFYFYTRLDEYEDDLRVFDQILDSFRFDAGFEYRDIHPAFTSTLWGKTIIGAIIGGIVGLLAGVLKKKYRKGEA